MRGARFTDLARNAIEIIDRNLYERSCDVRWWATDSAVVDVLAADKPEARDYATRRLATILRSYTVYLDLWVADAQGRVVATGRPERYPHAIGSDVSRTEWFCRAMQTNSGEDFHVCDIERSPVLHGAAVATYATAVRASGETHGARLGALGIFFDWEPQATDIVDGVRASSDEAGTCVMMLDQQKRVIASSHPDRRDMHFPLKIGDPQRGSYISGDRLIAYALTPGYETYRGLGWYGCIDAPLTPVI